MGHSALGSASTSSITRAAAGVGQAPEPLRAASAPSQNAHVGEPARAAHRSRRARGSTVNNPRQLRSPRARLTPDIVQPYPRARLRSVRRATRFITTSVDVQAPRAYFATRPRGRRTDVEALPAAGGRLARATG